MEIIIKIDEEGKIRIIKSEELPILGAVGLLELSKKIILENVDNFEKIEEDTDVEVENDENL